MVTLTPQTAAGGAASSQIVIQTVHGNMMSISVSLLQQIGIGRGTSSLQKTGAQTLDSK
ncbi:hypothetical protein LOC67_06440 [Stieleria sp. JC731]|uniref:hypothetical protein n=1 Tax=Pirellulaceae TaxID=2691357 RepID=UPI001E548907|nr:hypothetical protein [Stieleria sp. JC731]MCC9600192.1 hypothetical protein [Stieleria sp. JC731]